MTMQRGTHFAIVAALMLAIFLLPSFQEPAAEMEPEPLSPWEEPAQYEEVSDRAQRHAAALEMGVLVLERLERGEDAFPVEWEGGATAQGEIEVVVIWGVEQTEYDFVMPDAASSSPIMDAMRDWLSQVAGFQVESHTFVHDHHTGTYTNLLLSLPGGVFWLQLDAEDRVTKLWAEPNDPFPAEVLAQEPFNSSPVARLRTASERGDPSDMAPN